MRRLQYSLALLVIAIVPLAAVRFGGWAVITVDDLPDRVVAGQPMPLSYTVRQHGFAKLNRLYGRVEAKLEGSGERLQVDSKPQKDGQYVGVVNFPKAGEWLLTIKSGFMSSEVTLLPMTVVSSNAAPTRVVAESERGKRLFVAKGCFTCHVHGEVAGSGSVRVGPELSDRRFAVDYLASFLNDPSIKPAGPNGARMPKLDLSPREIASLTAFINDNRQVSANQRNQRGQSR
jgi:mono/diheme cytochrome c family protein